MQTVDVLKPIITRLERLIIIRWEKNGSMTSMSQSTEARTLSRPLAITKESTRV